MDWSRHSVPIIIMGAFLLLFVFYVRCGLAA